MRRSFAPVETVRGPQKHGKGPGVPIRAGVAHAPRSLPPLAEGGTAETTATVSSGRHAGYDGTERKKGPNSFRRTPPRPLNGTVSGWGNFKGTIAT